MFRVLAVDRHLAVVLVALEQDLQAPVYLKPLFQNEFLHLLFLKLLETCHLAITILFTVKRQNWYSVFFQKVFDECLFATPIDKKKHACYGWFCLRPLFSLVASILLVSTSKIKSWERLIPVVPSLTAAGGLRNSLYLWSCVRFWYNL